MTVINRKYLKSCDIIEINPCEITGFQITPSSGWWRYIIEHIGLSLNVGFPEDRYEASRILFMMVSAHSKHVLKMSEVSTSIITVRFSEKIIFEIDDLLEMEPSYLFSYITFEILKCQLD